MDKIDILLNDVAVLKTKLEILPELDKKVEDLCTWKTQLETKYATIENIQAKNVKKWGLTFTGIGVILALYNFWHEIFG